MKNGKKTFYKLFSFFAIVIVLAAALFCFRVRHGVIVKTDRTEVISREVRPPIGRMMRDGQRIRWGAHHLQ